MNTTENFKTLGILNPKTKSDVLLVKKTYTNELFVWRTVHLQSFCKEKKGILYTKVHKRIQQKHPLLVQFYPVIEDVEKNTLYIPMEYFPSGNIVDFIKKLKNSNINHINEEVIVKILFQLLMLLKRIDIYNYVSSKTIYFDEHFNVKVLNFSILHNLKKIDIKMCDIGSILIQLCTLNSTKLCDEYIVNSNYYSKEFIDLIEVMLNDTNNIKINSDKLLCHPVFLMNTFKLDCGMTFNGCIKILDYRTKLENLRKKEAMLKMKEKKFEDIEHALISREKKINLYEKEIKNKLVQAELYLRRCKNSKSLVNKYDIDNSAEYEEIECSDKVETSKKMNVDKLEKSCFTRTFSEKRVKFKGHSPLKEMAFHRGRSIRKSKLFKEQYTESNKFVSGEISSKKLRDISNTHKPALITKEVHTKKQSLCNENKVQVKDENQQNMGCLPITWTDENKKQAFDLLRIMNEGVHKVPQKLELRHTYL